MRLARYAEIGSPAPHAAIMVDLPVDKKRLNSTPGLWSDKVHFTEKQ
jgi:hypothetical protein